jgi:hypothetical protein
VVAIEWRSRWRRTLDNRNQARNILEEEKAMGEEPLERTNRIPLWLKVSYTAFVAVLVPIYWYYYSPLNFLYFCDVALLLTVPALWLESSYLASMLAVSITLPQLAWQIDFLVFPLFGRHFPIDLTGYMFDPNNPLFLRGLSFFHFWLPILLVWMVWRLGYVPRALFAQIGCCWLVLLLSYLFTTDINGPAGNVNKVLGLSGETPQTALTPLQWLGLLMLLVPVAFYLLPHVVFCFVMPRPQRDPHEGA